MYWIVWIDPSWNFVLYRLPSCICQNVRQNLEFRPSCYPAKFSLVRLSNQFCNVQLSISHRTWNCRRQIHSGMYNPSRLLIPQWEGKSFYRTFHILKTIFFLREKKKSISICQRKKLHFAAMWQAVFPLNQKIVSQSWILDHCSYIWCL